MTPSKTLRRQSSPEKVFTLDEANATLPLVRAIVTDLVELSREVTERRQRLSLLAGGPERSSHDPYQEELVQIEKEVEKDSQRLREYVAELRALGVEPTSSSEGLVDFPAVLDGRKVFLCWKLGDSHIQHWHEPGAGYRQRRPLPGHRHGSSRGGNRSATSDRDVSTN